MKPLPENLIAFYKTIGKNMQSIDTSVIDEIGKKFGRKKPLKFKKYGFSSAQKLLLSIEGFYKPKGMANQNAVIYREGGYKETLDENNNTAENMDDSKTHYRI